MVNTSAGAKYGQADYVTSGCGMGYETMYLTERGVRLTGIDGWSWDALRAYGEEVRADARREVDLGRSQGQPHRLLSSRSCTISRFCRRPASWSLLPGQDREGVGRLDARGGDHRGSARPQFRPRPSRPLRVACDARPKASSLSISLTPGHWPSARARGPYRPFLGNGGGGRRQQVGRDGINIVPPGDAGVEGSTRRASRRGRALELQGRHRFDVAPMPSDAVHQKESESISATTHGVRLRRSEFRDHAPAQAVLCLSAG